MDTHTTPSDAAPVLNQVNLITRDPSAALAFYRLLGLDIAPDAESADWPPGSGGMHAAASMDTRQVSLEFDNPAMVRLYAGDPPGVGAVVLGFSLPSSQAVDVTVQRLAAAGHPVRQPPYDAFWGARYALVADPDGNTIGLMGPRDRSRAYMPSGSPPST